MNCSSVWSYSGNANIMKLFKLQKGTARMVLNLSPRHSPVDIFNQLNWMQFYVQSDLSGYVGT